MRIYLDYNATSPAAPEVVETVGRLLATEFGNASSVHAFGQRAKAVSRGGGLSTGRPCCHQGGGRNDNNLECASHVVLDGPARRPA